MARFGGVYLEVGGAEEVRKCRDFYEKTLGFAVVSVNDDESFWLEAGGATFGFHTASLSARARTFKPSAPWTNSSVYRGIRPMNSRCGVTPPGRRASSLGCLSG